MGTEKKTDGLLFKFAVIFFLFTLITLTISGVNTYINQNAIYRSQCEETMQHIVAHMNELITADGTNFLNYQREFIKRKDELLIDPNFTDYRPEKAVFDTMLAKNHPGKVLGQDLSFDELSEEEKIAYTIYMHEYWLLTLEKTRDAFGVEYVYYMVPTGEPTHVYYVLDAVRDVKEVNGKEYINLAIDVPEEPEAHKSLWEAWDTGLKATGYDTFDNEYGKTYGYYAPLYINGEKVGIMGVDCAIASVNAEILRNTLRQLFGMGVIFILCVVVLLIVIHRRYISKLSHLQVKISDYAQRKDASIVGSIEKYAVGKDEISSLGNQIAAMILELENYMKNLVETTNELSTTKKQAAEMSELAHKDALTGIRNKTSYDNEARRIDWALEDGYRDFGIAMIDLNFLKRINDTYGHEKGNIAIRKLSDLVCTVFAHSPVFRIGGDEFAVILEKSDFRNIDALVDKFNKAIEEIEKDTSLEPWEKISASIGYAKYDPMRDNNVANVFKRADKAMYQRKKEMKAIRVE